MQTSLFLLLCGLSAVTVAAEPLMAGTLTGRFVYAGTPPTVPLLEVYRDEAFCGTHGLTDETLVVGPEGGVRNVIVWLDVKASGRTPTFDAQPPAPAVLDNAGCRFEPRVVLLQTEQELRITNSDPVAHNAAASLNRNLPFNVLVEPQGAPVTQTLAEPERLPVPIACSIHPWMQAWLLVQDHPYMAVSDADGRFTIEKLPPGEWTFVAWQEQAGYLQQVEHSGTPQTWTKGRFTVTVPASGGIDLGTVRLAAELFPK